MRKIITLKLVIFVLLAGCTKSEPDPVIVNISDNENESYPSAEIFGIDLNYPKTNDGEFTIIDFNSLLGIHEDGEKKPDVVYVPTPNDVVAKMLEMANVQKDDLLYDLGCGDGRIVVTAAQRFGCKAVGYDIDPKRIKESHGNVAKNNIGHLVTIEKKDIFTLDLSKANVITLYLLPSLNVRLIPQLEKLGPGSRIVSHDFSMRGVKPDEIVSLFSDEDKNQHKIFLWTTPLKKVEQNEQADNIGDIEKGFDYQSYEIPGLSEI
jgi:SAM-dependent methyltransferase